MTSKSASKKGLRRVLSNPQLSNPLPDYIAENGKRRQRQTLSVHWAVCECQSIRSMRYRAIISNAARTNYVFSRLEIAGGLSVDCFDYVKSFVYFPRRKGFKMKINLPLLMVSDFFSKKRFRNTKKHIMTYRLLISTPEVTSHHIHAKFCKQIRYQPEASSTATRRGADPSPQVKNPFPSPRSAQYESLPVPDLLLGALEFTKSKYKGNKREELCRRTVSREN